MNLQVALWMNICEWIGMAIFILSTVFSSFYSMDGYNLSCNYDTALGKDLR